jgi:2-polyprenyl-3-methyl-5-hydroxy-6-metoxy-1,4-benzoquinol methylase
MEMTVPTDREIASFFAGKAANARFVDRLKIRYRPYICPFRDLLEVVRPYRDLFDIGCGSGQFCLLAARFCELRRIRGIEIDQRLVDNARLEVSRMEEVRAEVAFSLFNGHDLPPDIGEFELVTMIDVLHHIPPHSQKSFLQQVYSRMRPDASLVLKDIDAGSPFVMFNKLHDIVFSGSAGHEWGHAAARRECESIGFHVKHSWTKRVGVYPHYFMHLLKA